MFSFFLLVFICFSPVYHKPRDISPMTWYGLEPSWMLSSLTLCCPCCTNVVLYSHSVIFGYKIACPGRAAGLRLSSREGWAPRRQHNNHSSYNNYIHPSHTPLGKLSKWPWLYPPSTPHFTRAAHLPHPSPKELVYEACIGTAQVGASLVAPLQFILKWSSLRSSRDMIILSWYIHLYWRYPSARCITS